MARPFSKLRGLMAEQGIDAGQIARELLISRTAVSKRMNAHFSWRAEEMYAVLRILEQPPEMLHILFPERGQNEPNACRGKRAG